MIGNLPPFAIETPTFRFRGLASHAGRAALGGDREIALACFVACRLGAGLIPPQSIAAVDLKARAMAAKQWLASLLLAPQTRNWVSAAIDASGDGDDVATARALGHLFPLVMPQLDNASIAEMRDLITELAHDSSEFEAVTPNV